MLPVNKGRNEDSNLQLFLNFLIAMSINEKLCNLIDMTSFGGFDAHGNTQKSPYLLMWMLKIRTLFDPRHSLPISRFLRFLINVLHSPLLPLLMRTRERKKYIKLSFVLLCYQRRFSWDDLWKIVKIKVAYVYESFLSSVFFSKNCQRWKMHYIEGGPILRLHTCVCVLLQERLWTTSDLRRAGGSHPGARVGRGCQHLPGIQDFANATKMGEIGQNRWSWYVLYFR